jgi:hypothetical protein
MYTTWLPDELLLLALQVNVRTLETHPFQVISNERFTLYIEQNKSTDRIPS